MSLHLVALEFRFVIALMTFSAVTTCFRQDGASGCPGIRRRQWIGISAAWRRKYLNEPLVSANGEGGDQGLGMEKQQGKKYLQYIPGRQSGVSPRRPESENTRDAFLGGLETAACGDSFSGRRRARGRRSLRV